MLSVWTMLGWKHCAVHLQWREILFPDVYFYFWGMSEDPVSMITFRRPGHVPLMTGCSSVNTLTDVAFIVRFSGFSLSTWLKFVSSIEVMPCCSLGLFHCIVFVLLPFSLFSMVSTCPFASGFCMRYRDVFLFSLPFLHIYLHRVQ